MRLLASNKYKLFIFISAVCLLQTSCKDEEPPIPEEIFVDDFYANTSTLELIVGYEVGAEPYVTNGGFDNWRVTDHNLNLLLNSRGIDAIVPHSLDSMTNLGILEQNDYSRQNILDLAADLQKHSNKEATKGIVLIFLDGYYIKDGVAINQILGLNIDGSAIVAIFKPVVDAASNETDIRSMVEQSTVTHELGHVLGLVNNGVRATTAHHDEANGAHCTNTDCVMYWQNGAGEVSMFMSDFLSGADVKLYGDQCITDVKAK